VPLENWGGMAKLWSVERGVCDAGQLACGDGQAMICEDLGDAELMASFPRASFELVTPAATPRNGVLPPDAFADEGPGVAADPLLATAATPIPARSSAAEKTAQAATASYCSFDEPNACESPIAALTPPSPADPAGYGPAGSSVLE
jgi:hypothetical protein